MNQEIAGRRRKQAASFLACLFVGFCLACADAPTLKAKTSQAGPQDVNDMRPWVVAGPFTASGSNALFIDYLNATGGESKTRARAGGLAASNPSGTVQWREVSLSKDGSLNFAEIWPVKSRSIAYAYTELESKIDRQVVATVGSGNNIQVRLNGEIIFESRLSRKPEPDRDTLVMSLRKGINSLLIKVEGGPDNWALRLKMHRPGGSLFINQRSAVIPDLREQERAGAWGQLEIANASPTTLYEVMAEVIGDDLFLPSLSEKTRIEAGSVRRIPIWIASKRPVRETDVRPIRLRVSNRGEEMRLELKPRLRRSTESFVTTYRSAIDGSVQPYSMLLPTSYDSSVRYPLIMLLHGAHVTDWGQNIISYEPKEWAIQVAVHDRGNNRYRDIGEVDLDEVMGEVKRRYLIDEERVYLSGHSMGGYGTWLQATRRPDLWAAISPQAGYADYSLYYPAMLNAGDAAQRRFQEQLLKNWSPLSFAENLLHVPAYIVHGAKDDNVSVEHSRRMAARLKELGYTFVYDENPEGGHWWGPRGKYYGMEVVDKPPIWTFFQKHSRRRTAPRRVVYTTDSLRYNKAYWVTIDELESADRFARIEAETVAPNTISVRLENITQFTLRLDERLIDADKPVNVTINGRIALRGPLAAGTHLTLRWDAKGHYLQLLNETDLNPANLNTMRKSGRVAAELGDNGEVLRIFQWSEYQLQKSAQLYGPVIDAFNKPFLFVVGSEGRDAKSKQEAEAARRAAGVLAREWMARAEGIVETKMDAEVTAQDIADYNLILFGNANTNRLIARINDQLPIRFAGAGLLAGGRTVQGADLGMVLAIPNPLNRSKYAVVIGGTTPSSFETAARLRLSELPDYVIFDRRTIAGAELDFVGGGFFDKYWRLTDFT